MIVSMRTTLLAVLVAAALPATLAAAPAGMRVYVNARYGYSIAYPPDLAPQPESANGDGRAFQSADGTAKALVWGVYNAAMLTPAQLADQAAADCTQAASYRRVTASLVAVSCVAGDKVLYQKTLIRGEVLTSFQITYAAAQGAHWQSVLTRMAGSMTAGR
ncbi:MAG: hypothetical protein ACHP84_11075 [Caulobacterales bacterium]